MGKTHSISIGGIRFTARSGQNLLEAALSSGVELPHDCRAGRCGACLTGVSSGITLGGEAHQPGYVLACQAMVFSDLDLAAEATPPSQRAKGYVTGIAALADGVIEVSIATPLADAVLPGQYCQFKFRGFPSRPFSPTAALDGHCASGEIRLHIKRVRGGRVTPHLGSAITTGHQVTIEGPYGHAYLRPGLNERLVLVGSGTGFAPVWAIAAAALHENPSREVMLLAASRKAKDFYMGPALEAAGGCPNVTLRACIEELEERHGVIVPGPPTDNLPDLRADDIVYAAGPPAIVAGVGEAARAAGSEFYCDPFETSVVPENAWGRCKEWLQSGRNLLGAWN